MRAARWTPREIPLNYGGPAFLIVQANSNGAVDVAPHVNDNTFALPIVVTPVPPADLVVHHGKVLTVDARFTTAEAVAIRDGQIEKDEKIR